MAAATTASPLPHTPAETWARHYATGSGRRWWPCEELVRAAARRGHLGRVLEVGCGNGANLWHLAEHGRPVGLDLCAVALADARSYTRERGADVPLAAGDAGRLPFADETFDGVVDAMVSQHVPWDAHLPLYREYRRVLRPGGWLFLYHLTDRTRPRGASRHGCDYDHVPLFPDVDRFCLPPAGALAAMVEASGFGAVALRGMAREYPDGALAHYAVVEGTADGR